MKKSVVTTLVLLVAFGLSAHAGVDKDTKISLSRVCAMLNEETLPAQCKAKCSEYTPPGGETTMTLTLSKEGERGDESEVTELSFGLGAQGDRTIVNDDKLVISAGEKLQENSLELVVNFNNEVQSLSVNKLECK